MVNPWRRHHPKCIFGHLDSRWPPSSFYVNMSLSIHKGGISMNHSTYSLYRKYKYSPSSSPFVVEGGVNSNDAIVELLLLINACKLASAESITVSSINLWSNSKNILRGTISIITTISSSIASTHSTKFWNPLFRCSGHPVFFIFSGGHPLLPLLKRRSEVVSPIANI